MKSIYEIPWDKLHNKKLTTSPGNWNEHVLYYVMIDRFSDNNEKGYLDNLGNWSESGTTPHYEISMKNNAIKNPADAEKWRAAGNTFVGGTFAGLKSKLGYIKRMGVNTIWLSPILKQTSHDPTNYHGYATQNFLNTDPRFGTPEEFQDLVRSAHDLGLWIILDIVFNHAGKVFLYEGQDSYQQEGQPPFNHQGIYPVIGFCDHEGKASIPFKTVDLKTYPDAWPDGAVWPKELQNPTNFHKRGCIGDWGNPDEYLYGDFLYLKDFHLAEHQSPQLEPTQALLALVEIYKYWIAYADIDGYRIDAVKHVPPKVMNYFVKEVTTFASRQGKDNFFLLGEIPGGKNKIRETLDATGLTAGIGIDDLPRDLVGMVKGEQNPEPFFTFFTGENEDQSHLLHPSELVTIYDDHDQIRLNFDKARFPAGNPDFDTLQKNALAVLLLTQGIPCIYYGSEQGFDGEGRKDIYIREAMFGGEFGAFRSKHAHFFNESHSNYQIINTLITSRNKHSALIYGDQKLLKISGNSIDFGLPIKVGEKLLGVIPWVRFSNDDWVLCAINTDAHNYSSAWVDVTSVLPEEKTEVEVELESNETHQHQKISITEKDDRKIIFLKLPPAGFVILT